MLQSPSTYTSCASPVTILDPLKDPRWGRFLERHPRASIFHTPGWLRALRRTYGYEAIVFTTSSDMAEIENGVPFCRVDSRLTGRRLVSIPFADHCEPLVDNSGSLESILEFARRSAESEGRKYVELRPLTALGEDTGRSADFGVSATFYFHRIDLSQSREEIFSRFHKTSIRQRIRRADREGLECREGTSRELINHFYGLLMMTRRKHLIPPQPRKWFHNLAECLGEKALIRVALKGDTPVAAIFTTSFGTSHCYKYGCSDPERMNMGGNAFLLSRAVLDAKAQGARWFDMGRTDPANEGLATYKAGWGAEASELNYYRSPIPRRVKNATSGWKMNLAGQIFQRLPDRVLEGVGRVLYRHMG